MRSPESYIRRNYRGLAVEGDLISFEVRVAETDLHILSDLDGAERAKELILQGRLQVEAYIQKHPVFQNALQPLATDAFAPPLVKKMMLASQVAGVGPMAAVAGTLSEYVGESLTAAGAVEVVVENGGDIYLYRKKDCTAAIFAGESPLSYTVGVRIKKEQMPCGVCTSSGTVGHSLSFGDADSVTVVAESTPLADAAATRLGNEVGENKGGRAGLDAALKCAGTIQGIRGAVVICGELLGAVGDIELVSLNPDFS